MTKSIIEENGLRITTTVDTLQSGFTQTSVDIEALDPENFEIENDGQQVTFFCCNTPKRRP